MSHVRELGRVRLYSCGGAGINIGSKVEQMVRGDDNVYADLDSIYIDTSKANLHSNIPADRLYLVDGKDGSGGDRAENYEELAPRAREILNTFKPADLNIVLSSGGGGTGPIAAACITSELLAQDALTIAIVVGDDGTKKWTENTLKALQSYENISTKRKKPVVVFYLQNSPDMTRVTVDKRIQELVAALMLLFSRRNRELDGQDLINWVNYQKVTSHTPGLTALTLVSGKTGTDLTKIGNLISIATLTTDELDPSLSKRPEVQTIGYVEGLIGGEKLAAPYHYILSDGIFGEVKKGLDKVLAEFIAEAGARLKKTSISSDAEQATDTGVVL